jgi:hypothetical protein
LKLIDILKESILSEYNKSQLEYIATKLDIERNDEFNALMNTLDSQGVKYPDLKNKIINGEIKSFKDLKSLKKQSKSDVIKNVKSDTEKVYEDDNFLVIIPYTHASNCFYGSGTKWCTTSDIEFWKEYVLDNHNTLYFVLDKTKSQTDILYKMAILVDDKNNIIDIFNARDKKVSIENYFKKVKNQTGYDLRDKINFVSKIEKILPIANKEYTQINQVKQKETQDKIQQYILKGSQGDLDVSMSNIDYLPSNLKVVNGDLDISSTKISFLPSGLKINGSLIALFTNLISLPSDLKVRDNITLLGPITSLPSDLKADTLNIDPFTPILKKYTIKQLKQMLPGVKNIKKY